MTGVSRPAVHEIAVVVPAADEAATIAAGLRAIAVAAGAAGPRIRTRVVVVLDDCTDGTAAIVAAHPGVVALVGTARCVGITRAIGTAHAIATAADPTRLWLAHTDADSLVPPDWLRGMLAAAGRGADLVLGTVVPDAGLHPARRARWTRDHDAGDGHRHVHGANLGIRADAYTALGGWRPLATGEDADLAARAEAAGMSITRSGRIPVRTSSRLHGRAPDGFAGFLRTPAEDEDQGRRSVMQ